jgi:outer membrane protein assembly factor BamD (BamD/ComL family)
MKKYSPDLENDKSFQPIRALLGRVAPPPKDANAWITLENELFSKLEAPTHRRQAPGFAFPSYFFKAYVWGPALAIALLAFSLTYRMAVPPAAPFARALSIRGTVVALSPNAKRYDTLTDLRDFNKFPFLGAHTAFSTLGNSSFVMQIDQSSAFELSENSMVTLKEITGRSMVFSLSKGSILLKVGTRSRNQRFMVETACASCIVVGTIFKVDAFETNGRKTALSVYEGKVKFIAASAGARQAVYVASGQTCIEENGVFGEVLSIPETETPLKNISFLKLLLDRQNPQNAPVGIVDVSAHPEIKHMGPAAVGLVPRKPERRLAPAVVKPESTLVAAPEYVEAMVQLTIGEYQKAIGILDSLKNTQPLDMKSRMSIMLKINESYLKLGNFSNVLGKLDSACDRSTDNSAKERLLWEKANILANCLGDYQNAEKALVELLTVNPSGKCAKDALIKLAEIQYMLGKFDCAAATYRKFLKNYPSDPDFDKTLFSLADIVDNDLHGRQEALNLYGRLLNERPHSAYAGAAQFARAQCLIKLGRAAEARAR